LNRLSENRRKSLIDVANILAKKV